MNDIDKRDVVKAVLNHEKPPYVPWSFGFTVEARAKLLEHYGDEETLEGELDNHFLGLGNDVGFFENIGNDRYRDVFGVVWNRSVDRDIGIVEGNVLEEPTLSGYTFPDPLDRRFFEDIDPRIDRCPDRFRVFSIGFSLYERAWTLRGMENLLIDFYHHPQFVRELLEAIADYNIAQARKAMVYDIDAVYFGDDWGQQNGLIMGPKIWREFIKPVLERMYRVVRENEKYVVIHSCGDVDEVFDDLVEIGLSCFNPFQPEVMDIHALLDEFRDRLSFYGGLSTQRTLPFGSPGDVRAETERLLRHGFDGGYILSPAHAVEGDVPLENMLAFIETARGFREAG